jgi:hypothetical protein
MEHKRKLCGGKIIRYCRLERVLVQAIVIGKVTPNHAMKGCKRSRDIASRPALFTGGGRASRYPNKLKLNM